MGGCTSRLRAEMVAPPQRDDAKIFYPQRPEPYLTRAERQILAQKQAAQRNENRAGSGAKLERKETPSGILGLTYDHAGRPVSGCRCGCGCGGVEETWKKSCVMLGYANTVGPLRWREEVANPPPRIQVEHRESV
ncbi:hypothetical protein LOCC1_G004648 [Lachnellula occidentalis]|uniref:Uncharacterized protein n=1 Tax=Lachnellula occidentalis TaxID=215460 RepID=A0A8H8RZ21_9HELO|nr:hypothetical protein LOCC1_G004648 [Lachnellula occidentalis]